MRGRLADAGIPQPPRAPAGPKAAVTPNSPPKPGKPASWPLVEAGGLVVFFVYVWRQVDPALQFHAKAPVFYYGADFFAGFSSRLGGLSEYAAAFLAQCNQVSWLGALLATFAAAALGGLTWALLRAARNGLVKSAHCVPPALLLLLWSRYDHSVWPPTFSLLLVLGCGWVLVQLPRRNAWLWLGAFMGLLALLAYVAGPIPALLFAVVATVCVKSCRGLALACLSVAVVGTLVWLGWVGSHWTDGLRSWGLGWTWWLTLALYLFGPLAILARDGWSLRTSAGTTASAQTYSTTSAPTPRHKQSHTPRPTAQRRFIDPFRAAPAGWLVLALAAGLAWWTQSPSRRARIQLDYSAERQDWSGVLETAPRLRLWPASARLHLLRALYHTGRLGSDLFAFPQRRGEGLLPSAEAGPEPCRALSQTLLELGQVNLAEHFAHEALECDGERPGLLQELALINVLKNRPAAARIFWHRLRRAPFHRSSSDDWLRELEGDAQLAGHPELARIRAAMPRTDYAASRALTEWVLEQLLESNPHNRMAFEYLMAHYLLTAQVEGLVRNLDRFAAFDYATVPRHYQEAIFLFQARHGIERARPYLQLVDARTRQRFEQFQAQLSQFRDQPAQAQQALAGDFGDTFWYYCSFGQTPGQAPLSRVTASWISPPAPAGLQLAVGRRTGANSRWPL